MFTITTGLTTGATGLHWTISLEVGGFSRVIASSPKDKTYPSVLAAIEHASDLLANMLADAFRAGLERGTGA